MKRVTAAAFHLYSTLVRINLQGARPAVDAAYLSMPFPLLAQASACVIQH